MRDIVVIALLVLSFAFVLTIHVSIAIGLLARTPRWRGFVALFVPVIGLIWAWRSSMRARVWMWIIGVVVYCVALLLSFS
jgi:hypothetical protein